MEVGRARNSACHRIMDTYGHVNTGRLAHVGAAATRCMCTMEPVQGQGHAARDDDGAALSTVPVWLWRCA